MLLFCLAALGAHASNFSGLWYKASESGWGLNLSQQGTTIFATMFVYGPDSRSKWYVASNMAEVNPTAYSGDLLETTGSWFGGTFNPDSFTWRKVGTITFTSEVGDTGTVIYSVDGVSVTKAVTRQTWRAVSLEGDYRVAIVNITQQAQCNLGLSAYNDIRVRDAGSVTIYAPDGASACEITGKFSQYGEYNWLSGTIACSASQGNFSGTVEFSDIRGDGIAGLTSTTQFLTGFLYIRGAGGCQKQYKLAGTYYIP
jgi:hypothetical protein